MTCMYVKTEGYRANLAHKVQILVGRPELKDFLRDIDMNSIKNCPIAHQDTVNVDAAVGRDLGARGLRNYFGDPVF
jgi:hypothetical protein